MTGPNVTINSYFEIWKKIKSGIRNTSFATYLRIYQRYIEPQFGNTTLRGLSYSKVVLFYKDLIENRNLNVSYVNNINKVLCMILDVAIRDGVYGGGNCGIPQLKIFKALKANKIKVFKNESLIIIHNLRQTYDKFTNTKESPQRITTGVPVVV